ncbi:serine hydrolase [Leptospira sp. 96542]|nr:serine hydrolase [Leptospira sp. 96542]
MIHYFAYGVDMQTDLSSEQLEDLLNSRDVIGASVAVVNDGTVSVVSAGLRDVETNELVNPDTVFDAASLTKPLVSYAVLQLVESGVISLDEPVAEYVRPLVADDARSQDITVRHLLTHTAGLQNLRDKEQLRIFYTPGSWFSYSSLGFMYLQMAIEAKTGEPFEVTMRRLVFDPLGMQMSSLEWNDALATDEAIPHESGAPVAGHRTPSANASYSLKTTAKEYGAFLAAALGKARSDKQPWRDWLSPAVMVPLGSIIHLEGLPNAFESNVGWGLGWGLEPQFGTFFQWGKMPGMRAFVMGSPRSNSGFVLFANCNTGLRLMKPLAEIIFPGEHPAIRLLLEEVTE